MVARCGALDVVRARTTQWGTVRRTKTTAGAVFPRRACCTAAVAGCRASHWLGASPAHSDGERSTLIGVGA